MKNFSKNYYIGLDIGTNSVGWAVINEDFSVRKKGDKHMWGSRLFDDAKSAADTRIKRQARRRLERRKERIRLLRSLFEESVAKVDPAFFTRLDKSFLLNVKKDCEFGRDNLYNLFDGAYTDKDYYKNYKTIYHLRKHLIESDEKADIRLIYLAVHHIIKYRGNFLTEGEFYSSESGVNFSFNEFIKALNEREDNGDFLQGENVTNDEICEILTNEKIRKNEKLTLLKSRFKGSKNQKRLEELVKALLGYKTSFNIIFDIEIPEDCEKKDYVFAFSDSDYQEKTVKFTDNFGDEITALIAKLFEIYQNIILTALLGEGNKYISDGMIRIYEKHKSDLKKLKTLLKDHPELYKDMFGNKKRESYTGYIKNDRQSKNRVSDYRQFTQEEFYKAVKKSLENISDCDIKNEILADMADGNFLPKINSVKNAAVPYQLHELELKQILNNQKRFYPELERNVDKIISILTFRRPYSIGVLSSKSRFSWVEEGQVAKERITPWNFFEKIDVNGISANFITRMTSRCMFLPEERVLPKDSFIYRKYTVLNELNKIKITDKIKGKRPLTVEEKKALYNELFTVKQTVRVNDVRIFLKNKFGVLTDGFIEGLSDDKKFTSSLSSYIKLKNILSENQMANGELVENIIEDIAVFSDKKIRYNALKKLIPDKAILDKLCNLSFSGWGSFSKKLLTEVKSYDRQSILDIMYNTNLNFNQIINDETFGIKEQLFKDVEKQNAKYSAVNALYISPAVKRAVWQAVKIVREIVKIEGTEPRGIYIESTRKDDKKQKSKSRAEKLKEIFDSVIKDQVFYDSDVAKTANNTENQVLQTNDMLYLYHLQMGKSMYSGKSLGDISQLAVNCEIDHIIPQCLIKDDSLNNRVLVLKEENQLKSGSLVISKAVRDKMTPFWEYLLENGFIGKAKYFALTREKFSEQDVQHFINRQLVETNQSVKATRDLFKKIYPQADVEMVKAGISSEFRKSMTKDGYLAFIKLRDLNDFHHAKDAYLACAIARFTRKIYPIWGADSQARFLKDRILNARENEDVVSLVNRRNGIVVDAMKFSKPDNIFLETGEVIDWNTCFNNILTCFEYNDCLVTKHTEITAKPDFYKITIYGVNDKNAKGDISIKTCVNRDGIKKELPLSYGRYSGQNSSYFLNVKYTKGKEEKIKLMGVPVKVAYNQKADSNAVIDYFKTLLGKEKKTFVSIEGKKVELYQLIRYGGQLCYITSDSYLINATQLIVDKKYNPMLYAVSHPYKYFVFDKRLGEKRLISDREYFEPIMKEFAFYHAQKVKKLYPLYERIAEQTEQFIASGKFDELPYFDAEKRVDKAEYVSRLLALTSARSTQLDMKAFGGSSGWGMLSGKSICKNEVEWHYYSVTGLNQKVVKATEILNGK